jgi:transposase
MRGLEGSQVELFAYVQLESRIPKDHPLRRIKPLVDHVLNELDGEFEKLYSGMGRPSIPPEQLLRASLLQILYTIRSERQLVEQLDYNLLFRWFVGLGLEGVVWDPTSFTKNRERLLDGGLARKFLEEVIRLAEVGRLLSEEHFTVDGTLIEAWASQKSFQAKADSDDDPGNFKGQKRANDSHQSITEPDARLYKKGAGKEAKLCFMGHVLMENRHGLVVNTQTTLATGTAEREAALVMVKGKTGITLGGDKGYDAWQFHQDLKAQKVTSHVAWKEDRWPGVERWEVLQSRGYKVSQVKRKRIEEVFGWMKTVGSIRKVKLRGLPLVSWLFDLNAAAYNLIRIKNLKPRLSNKLKMA